MYCFYYGFPTRTPGTWMPSTCALTCGNTDCLMLAGLWSEMWERGRGANWQQRQAMECAMCSKERQRRMCVFQDSEEDSLSNSELSFDNFPVIENPIKDPTLNIHNSEPNSET